MVEENEGYLSDESSFYGDEHVKASYEERVKDVEESRRTSPSITEIADINIAKTMAIEANAKTTKLSNPYEGMIAGRQLRETVDQFLRRLPPSSTQTSVHIPWIFIANPFISRDGCNSNLDDAEVDSTPEDGTSLAQFVVLGRNLLEELSDEVSDIAKKLAGQPPLKITKAQNREKDAVVAKLKEMALEMGVKTGKWMLFVSPADVNEVWAVIAKNTASGDLGIAAKVAPDGGDYGRSQRVICIYTENFDDREDVRRVVTKLKDLGCVSGKGRAIYYKADMYTHLQLNSGNEYNIKPSLYSSAEFLGANQARLDGFLKRKQ